MNSTLFRKASLERVSSPEQLNDYIRVSNPGVWMILGAIIILLAGVCVWGMLGTLETTRETVVISQDGTAVCYVSAEFIEELREGMTVNAADAEGEIISVAGPPIEITGNFDPYALYLSGMSTGDWVYPVTISAPLGDGVYMAEIVVEIVSPISFVLN